MLHQLNHLLQKAKASNEPLVQIRIIGAQGSSYRKIGARMIIDSQGQHYNMVSGGCLENHLAKLAKQVFLNGKSQLVDYDFSDPDGHEWLTSVGCHGQVSLLLERLDSHNKYHSLQLYIQARQAEQAHWMVTDLDANTSQLHSQKPSGQDKTTQKYILEPIQPAPKLMIIGTGADVDAIINLAHQLDFLVQVIGSQSHSISRFKHRFPTLLHTITPEQLNHHYKRHPADYVLIMNHNVDLDAQFLSQSCLAQARLVGLLGPADRKQRVLDCMHSLPPSNLVTPVGLNLGGHGAESVALSVMAQLQADANQRPAQGLWLHTLTDTLN